MVTSDTMVVLFNYEYEAESLLGARSFTSFHLNNGIVCYYKFIFNTTISLTLSKQKGKTHLLRSAFQ